MKAPKTSSTFGNILARAACPGIQLRKAQREFGPTLLQGCKSHGKVGRLKPGHLPLPHSFKTPMTIVSIFREPKSRTVSGYHHNLHDCRALQHEYGIDEWRDVGLLKDEAKRRLVYGREGVNPYVLRRYAACVGACQTRMLLGSGCGDDRYLGVKLNASLLKLDPPVIPRDVQRAVSLVQNSFAFVGTTDLFRESVRAFGVFAGVPVQPEFDYVNTRPSWAGPRAKALGMAALADTVLLDSFVYRAAQQRLAAFSRDCQPD